MQAAALKSAFVRALPVFILLVLGASAADAANSISGNIFTEADNAFTVLLVDKQASELHIAEVNNKVPQITKSYAALHGRNSGDKLKEGDNKTPEGFYYITGYVPPDKLDSTLYGDGAFTLNYPNVMDKYKGKTGHGIWIHGRGADRNNEKTQGCVSLSNRDLTSIKPLLLPGTPVIISDTIEFLSPEDYSKNKKKHMDFFKRFISSWENSDFKGFASYFSANFRAYDGLSAENYLNKKKQLMLTNPKRKVFVSDVNIFKENANKLMYSFNQLYCSDNIMSYGSKKLYLMVEKADNFRIIAEEFTELELEPFLEKSVISTVNNWKTVWQARDIEKYISYYSSSFRSDDMDIKQWKAHKEGLFQNTKTIKVNLTDIKLKAVSSGKIVVSFIQEYTSGAVADRGIKTLVLTGCPGDYKIIEEVWRPALTGT
ncbi:L,D-transpeptidase family protein [Candidatus Magnetominusculus xianensis]|uniref:Transpeptidase n=1 Tax=Candidatus Magnetominusculus xianensis TaxID=1748249 RepID=A0ABR5SBQ2_9BACT|nr:L,D-transpeptidase family protein [Candidatus Magnetominusculus xianensis]KWT78134.1 transpeptidase [Candidatus Magnetominusculus xianensis]